MKNGGGNQPARGVAFCALCALALVAWPSAARAQAGPGPIRPAPGTQGDSTGAPRIAADEPKPPDRKELWGTWKLDVAQSDDAMQQIKDAKTTGGSGGGPEHGRERRRFYAGADAGADHAGVDNYVEREGYEG